MERINNRDIIRCQRILKDNKRYHRILEDIKNRDIAVYVKDNIDSSPDPTAIPMSAAFSAGASLTPSPVIATTFPFDWRARTMYSLCLICV